MAALLTAPKIDSRRIEIVTDKTNDAARQTGRQYGNGVKPLLQCHHDDRHGGYRRYTGRQPVQSVNKVHYIGEADYPEDGKGHRQVIQIKIAAPWIVQPFDPNAEQYRHQGCCDLTCELDPGSKLEHIIRYPHCSDHTAAQQDPDNVRCQLHGRKCCRHECDDDGQAAHTGHDPVMYFSGIGSVHGTKPERQPLDRRCQGPADQQGQS